MIPIDEEMRRSYLDYAMSVIVSRALPDVRDGLKPVHRRILYAMREGGYDHNKPFRKSARIVGEVMGKYHPHGDSAIYDAMVRMAQPFSMRLTLVDGQGNFGSMDADKPAAMRYTEARLARVSSYLLDDIEKDTVDFQPNYDESLGEPSVLPARYPNLLVNGGGGIAVGMATNIPPHNLGEVVDACCALIDNPDLPDDDLLSIVHGPDFPTGGVILGRSGIRSAFLTGRGSIILRGRVEIEEMKGDRQAIVVTEIPYQVNKAAMVEKIGALMHEKKIEGISALRDESDRRGVRVVIEVRRDAQADVVLAQLYRFTPLQTTFSVNMLALNGGRPEQMTLRGVLKAFLAFREQVIRRRTIFELGKARERAHILVGLAIAVENLDEVIDLIRSAPDPQTARERLMARDWPAKAVEPFIRLLDEPGVSIDGGIYRLSEAQTKAILDLRLHRLTGLERSRIHEELAELGAKIEEYLAILASRERLHAIMREELVDIRGAYADERRTTLEENEFEADIEDLIQREDMVVTVTNTGYIKRVPLATYRAQRRGGRGRTGMATREEDFVTNIFVANTHTPLIFFSSDGLCYRMKVYRLPLGSPTSLGKAMVNLLPLSQGERITTVMPLPEDETTWGDLDVMFATETGNVRRNRLSDFQDIRSNGKIAMKLDEGDHLVGVRTCTDADDVLLTTNQGKAIRFPVSDVRVFAGRTSTGVRGIRLAEGDQVNCLSILRRIEATADERAAYLKQANALRRTGAEGAEDAAATEAQELTGLLPAERFAELQPQEEFILTVTAHGFGKRTSSMEYRSTSRGGQGIANIEMSERNGPVVSAFPVAHCDQVMLITDGGQVIRMPVNDVRIAGRKTQGVTLFRLSEGENVMSVAHLGNDGVDEDGQDGECPPLADGNEPAAGPDAPEAPSAGDGE